MLANTSSRSPVSPDDLVDAPVLAAVGAMDLRSSRIFAGKLQGERRSKKRGRSVEFDDYRLYTPGDDLRFIDWNAYARFDRMFIKLFLEEEDLALHLAIDASPSMHAGNPSKVLFAARLATALAWVGLVNNNRVAVSVFGAAGGDAGAGGGRGGVKRLPDLRGRREFRRVVEFIHGAVWGANGSGRGREGGAGAGAGSSQVPSLNESLSTIARLRTGKGVMAVISDFMVAPEPGAGPDAPGCQAGLRALSVAGGYDAYCLQVLSPGEVEPEREMEQGVAGDLRLVDVETGRATEVTITAALIKQYKKNLERWCAALHEFCSAREMSHLVVRSDSDLQKLVVETLRQAGMVA